MLKELKLYKELESRNTESSKFYIANIDIIYIECKNILERVPSIFHNYTKHDISHSENVIEIMGFLVEDLNKHSDLEITILIVSAITHDLGMYMSDLKINNIRNDSLILGNRKYSKVFESIKDDKAALEECIRPQHAKLSKDIMNEMLLNKIKNAFKVHNSEHNFFEVLCKINESHTESIDWIRGNINKSKSIGKERFCPNYISIILRLSDLLDIDDRRTPFVVREFLNLPVKSIDEWDKHSVITNQNKIEYNKDTLKNTVFLDGETSHPDIYRQILMYIDYIESQLVSSIDFCLKEFSNKEYHLNLDNRVRNAIKTNGFQFADFRLKLDYQAITELLMGENIYGSKEYGVRELIQNSLDACTAAMYVRKIEKHNDYNPEIKIIWDEDSNELVIVDNGIGMSESIIKKYFLNIGLSYYKSDDFQYSDNSLNPIGNYGIGFLSCFMLSPKVIIKTNNIYDNQTIEVSLNKDSEFIELSYINSLRSHGTEIILELNKVKEIFQDIKKIEDFIKVNFLNSEIKIKSILISNNSQSSNELELISFEDLIKKDNYINLTHLFKDVQVYVKFKGSKIKIYNGLKDLDEGEFCYVVKLDAENNLKLNKVEDYINVLDFVDNEILNYLEIPIITGDNMVEALMYHDEIRNAINHVDNKIVRVYYNPNDIQIFEDIDNPEDILFKDKLTMKNVISYKDIETVVGIKSEYCDCLPLSDCKYNVLVESNQRFLRLTDFNNLRNFWNYFGNRIHFYVKGVLVKNFDFQLNPMIYGLEIERLVINSTNKNIVPNISRNDFNNNLSSLLSYSIRKAIVLDAIRSSEAIDRSVLELFYEKYLQEDSIFLIDNKI